MRLRQHSPWFILPALLLSASVAVAQEKHRLSDVPAVGDVSVEENTLEMTLKIQVTVDGQETPVQSFVNREREKYREEILAVGDRRPTALRRAYEIARSAETDPAGKQTQKVSSLQGKTVTVRLAGGKPAVSADKGKLDPEDEKRLASKVEDSPSFFPDREVGPGDEWTVDTKQLPLFSGADKVEVKGKFVEVVAYGGHRCAKLHMEMIASGKPEGSPAPLSLTLVGDAYYALDLKRGLSLELSGPLTMKGESKEDGKTLLFNGEGTMKMTVATTYLKVAGKPVAAQ